MSRALWLLVVMGCAGAPDAEPVVFVSDLVDADGDGLSADHDCDDTDAELGGPELPYDGVDNDCDPTTPDDDADGDGVPLGEDCDDSDPFGWLASEDPWVGDVTSWDRPCEGYCRRPVTGSIDIDRPNEFLLDNLRCITTVGGDLRLDNSDSLKNLDELESLRAIAGGLYLEHNPDLKQIDALAGVMIAGDVVIIESKLSDLAGLAHLDHLGGDLVLDDHPKLEHLRDLQFLEEVSGTFTLRNTGVVALSDLVTLTHVGGLDVGNNDELVDLSGMDDLQWIDGDLVLDRNPDVTTLVGLPEASVGGALVVRRMNGLTTLEGARALDIGALTVDYNLGLESLSGLAALDGVAPPIEGDVTIVGNSALTALDRISTSIEGSLTIEGNDALLDLEGLEKLDDVGGSLVLLDNRELLDVTALHGLVSVGGDVQVIDNGALPAAAVAELVSAIDQIGGEVTMSGNGP